MPRTDSAFAGFLEAYGNKDATGTLVSALDTETPGIVALTILVDAKTGAQIRRDSPCKIDIAWNPDR